MTTEKSKYIKWAIEALNDRLQYANWPYEMRALALQSGVMRMSLIDIYLKNRYFHDST